MRVAMIADLMPGGSRCPNYIGEPIDVHAANEEGGRNIEPVQDIEQLVSPFARSIIKCKGNCPAMAGTAVNRGR